MGFVRAHLTRFVTTMLLVVGTFLAIGAAQAGPPPPAASVNAAEAPNVKGEDKPEAEPTTEPAAHDRTVTDSARPKVAAPPAQEDPAAKVAATIGDLIKDGKWALLALVILVCFHGPLRSVLEALADRFKTSEVQFQIAPQNFSLKLEVPVEGAGAVGIPFLPSGLDLEASAFDPHAKDFAEIGDYLSVTVTDDEVIAWVTTPAGRAAQLARQTAYDQLRATLEEGGADLKSRTVDYLRALEACRFYEAQELTKLLAQSQTFKKTLDALHGTPEGRLVDHALAVVDALAQNWDAVIDRLKDLANGEPPRYLPPVDILICAQHNRFVATIFSQDSSSPEAKVAQLYRESRPIWDKWLQHVRDDEWGTEVDASQATAYYEREFYASLGLILSTIAEIAPKEHRGPWLAEAARHFESCLVGRETPTARDFNNYADLLRQQRSFDKALEQCDQVVKWLGGKPDPFYCETRARVLCELDRRVESLLAIQEFDEKAAVSGKAHEFERYIKNQLVRARLLFRFAGEEKIKDMAPIVRVLLGACETLDREGSRFGLGQDSKRRGELEFQLREALFDAYLQSDAGVENAQGEYERINGLKRNFAIAEAKEHPWRRALALSRARTRRAQIERQNGNKGYAEMQRYKAEALLGPRAGAIVKELPLGADVDRQWQVRLCMFIDALEVNVDLATECCRQGDTKSARDLVSEGIAVLQSEVEAALVVSRGSDLGQAERTRFARSVARSHLLKAHLAGDGAPVTDAVAKTVKDELRQAHGVDDELSARADLALGQFLLNAALTGKGDNVGWHDDATFAFDQAMKSPDAAVRREAARGYAMALSQRSAVAQRAKASGPAKA